MPDEEYHVKAIQFWKSEHEPDGYVPMIVDARGRIAAYALAGGLQSGNDQPHHPTPEEAMAAYNGAQPYQPMASNGRPVPNNEPYSDLLRALHPQPSIVMAGIASEG
jgi:hypothetical protein